MPVTPVAKESTPSSAALSEPAPPFPEVATTAVPIKNGRPDQPQKTMPAPTPATVASTIPVHQEDVPTPQDAVRPKISPTRSYTPVEDEDEAGPSGLNCHPSSSSSSDPPAQSAPFIPFSGGGQRLGGPGKGTGGCSLTSSSSLSALAATVESPKAKKAKPSHSLSSKVGHSTT